MHKHDLMKRIVDLNWLFLGKIFFMTPTSVAYIVVFTTIVVCIFIARDMIKK